MRRTQRPLEQQNLFLPVRYRHLAPERIPDSVVKQTRRLVEEALGSVFTRMTVPVITGSGHRQQNVRLFSYLDRMIKTPGVKVVPSGGVVRSALGYLMTRIHAELSQDPRRDPHEVLRRIARHERADISGWDIKGNGSDFDLLLKGPESSITMATNEVLKIVNSVETRFKMEGDRSAVKRNLLFIGDVKPYDQQIAKSTSQGGVTLDFLAYDLDAKTVLEPRGFHNILDAFLRGRLSYAPPAKSLGTKPPQKQAIRGIRPLLEFPFTTYAQPARFLKELRQLKRSVAAGKPLEDPTKDQIGKAIRNAHFAGVNRIHKRNPDTVERAIQALNRTLKVKTDDQHYIPKFVPIRPLEGRDSTQSGALRRSWFIPVDKFIREHTPQGSGILYHGTPNMDFALSINRQGLLVSSEKQGRAAMGYGGYLTADLDTARGYAGNEGVVLQQRVKNDRRLRILDWTKVRSGDPLAQKLIREARRAKKEPFEYLADDHGIDLIVVGPKVVLVENMSAIEKRFGVKEILDLQTQSIRNSSLPYAQRTRDLFASRNLIDYGRALGMSSELKGLSIPRFLGEVKRSFMRSRSPPKRRDAMEALELAAGAGYDGKKLVDPVSRGLRSKNLSVMLAAAKACLAMERRARRSAVRKVDLESRLTRELEEVRLRHDPARLRTVTEVAKVAGQLMRLDHVVKPILLHAMARGDSQTRREAMEAALAIHGMAETLGQNKSWINTLNGIHDTIVAKYKRTRSVEKRLALLADLGYLYHFPIKIDGSIPILHQAIRSVHGAIRDQTVSLLEESHVIQRLRGTPAEPLSDGGFLRDLALSKKFDARTLGWYQESSNSRMRWDAARRLVERGHADHITVAALKNMLPPKEVLSQPHVKRYYKEVGLFRYLKEARQQAAKLPKPSSEIRARAQQIEASVPYLP